MTIDPFPAPAATFSVPVAHLSMGMGALPGEKNKPPLPQPSSADAATTGAPLSALTSSALLDCLPPSPDRATGDCAIAGLAALCARLRCAAAYGPFRPKALACCSAAPSLPHIATDDGADGLGGNGGEEMGRRGGAMGAERDSRSRSGGSGFGGGPSPRSDQEERPSIVGTTAAVAGPLGVAVFATSRPHRPSIILHHASPEGTPVSSLAFQPLRAVSDGEGAGGGGGGSLLLAAARGGGVLVWDVSGRSASPLLGRLGCDARPASTLPPPTFRPSPSGGGVGGPGLKTSSSRRLDLTGGGDVSCVSWRGPHLPILVTSTPHIINLWDLRCWSSRMRPSVRFASEPPSSRDGSHFPFVHVSCDELTHRIAAIDSGGTVRVYDDRATSSLRTPGGSGSSTAPLSSFRAHNLSGAGVSWTPGRGGRSSWVTWGLETASTSGGGGDWGDCGRGCVRVWEDSAGRVRRGKDSNDSLNCLDADDYWFVDNEEEDNAVPSVSYSLLAQFGMPDVSCARVCPHPFANGIVAVGTAEPADLVAEGTAPPLGNWQADLWVLGDSKDRGSDGDSGGDSSFNNFGAHRAATFRFGGTDDSELSSMVGGRRYYDPGHLIAAELAVGPAPLLPPVVSSDDGTDDVSDDYAGELLVCTLSSTGYLTTHAIPEAVLAASRGHTKSRTKDRLRGQRRPGSPLPSPSKRLQPSFRVHEAGRTGVGLARVFRNSCDSSIRPDGEEQAPEVLAGNRLQRDLAAASDALSTAEKGQDIEIPLMDPITQISRGVEGGMMQFDMDPIQPEAEGVVDPGSGASAADPGVVAAAVGAAAAPVGAPGEGVAEDEAVEGGGGQSGAAAVGSGLRIPIDPFRAMNVPCPRLCGASFGFGGGGVLVFHNGEVRRMWAWFQSGGVTPSPDVGVPLDGTPRTMLELMRMNAAAKIALWGDDNADTDNEEGKSSASDDELDGESDEDTESNSSDSDNYNESFLLVPEHTELSRTKAKNNPFDNYFSVMDDNDKGSVLPAYQKTRRSHVGGNGSTRKAIVRESVFVPSVDLLAPVVAFTRQHDGIILNGQCHELADGFELGPWWLTSEGDVARSKIFSTPTQHKDFARKRGGGRRLVNGKYCKEADTFDNDGYVWVEESLDTPTSGDYRPIFSSLTRTKLYTPHEDSGSPSPPVSPNKSFPSIEYIVGSPEPPLVKSSSQSSPSEKKSGSMMGNIKKLFYQQHQGSMKMVPLDQYMMKKTKGRNAQNNMRMKKEESLGVHTLNPHSHGGLCDLAIRQLIRTKNLCEHNRNVCSELGQIDKAKVWTLLLQVVDNIPNSLMDNFDGWGGPGGCALGHELVENILRYYEAQGDVQMLATIICVLSGGRDRRMTNRMTTQNDRAARSGLHSLLPDDDARFDAYILRYSALLYAWGKLTTRTELTKHLAYSLPGAGAEQLIPVEASSEIKRNQLDVIGKDSYIPNEGVASGITFAPMCPRCQKPANPETNVCDSCKDYAFRCSICTNAVRGLFTVCVSCGHGGHVEHIIPWFVKNTVCPSGCGCDCVLSTYGSSKDGNKPPFLAKGGAAARRNTMGFRPVSANAGLQDQTASSPMELLGTGVGSVPFGAYSAQPSLSPNQKLVSYRSPQKERSSRLTHRKSLY